MTEDEIEKWMLAMSPEDMKATLARLTKLQRDRVKAIRATGLEERARRRLARFIRLRLR